MQPISGSHFYPPSSLVYIWAVAFMQEKEPDFETEHDLFFTN